MKINCFSIRYLLYFQVMNEKINHCLELAELVSSHVNDKYYVRLEWMVIILIVVEVAFEMLHFLDSSE